MNWEDDLRSASRDLGRRLELAHPNPPRRRRIRPVVIAAAVGLSVAAYVAWPRDPAAAIEKVYAPQFVEVRIQDPRLRLEFETAMAQVERAIAIAKDAVRRSPSDPAFAELCHLALKAKVRLIQAYSTGG